MIDNDNNHVSRYCLFVQVVSPEYKELSQLFGSAGECALCGHVDKRRLRLNGRAGNHGWSRPSTTILIEIPTQWIDVVNQDPKRDGGSVHVNQGQPFRDITTERVLKFSLLLHSKPWNVIVENSSVE